MTSSDLQKRVYQNKIAHGFNVTDISKEFCLLYLQLFFPFEKQDFHKKGMEYLWNIDAHYDQALALTYSGYPLATVMSFTHGYGERFDWLKRVFKDWTFNQPADGQILS